MSINDVLLMQYNTTMIMCNININILFNILIYY